MSHFYVAREPTHLDPYPNKISGIDHAAWSIDLRVATPTHISKNQILLFLNALFNAEIWIFKMGQPQCAPLVRY